MPPSPRLVLFDVDGTLVHAYGAGRRAMERAGQQVLGSRFSLENVDLAGRLDPDIFAEAARASGYEPDDEIHAAFRELYLTEIAGELEGGAARCEALPGARELVEAVCALGEHVARGMVTGNYAGAAAVKLRAAAIDPDLFHHCGFGDEAPTRPGLVEVALARHEQATGIRIARSAVLVIGDTPYDVDCARRNGCRSLAVATGRHDSATLEAAGADLVVESLADLAPVLAALGAEPQHVLHTPSDAG